MSKVLKNALIILLVAMFASVSLSACGKAEKKEAPKAAEAAKAAVDAAKPAVDAAKKAVDDDFKPKKELVFPKNMD